MSGLVHDSADPAASTVEAGGRARCITAARTEMQYRVAPDLADELAALVARHLPERSGPLGGSRVTTVYYDTPWGSVLETCERGVLSDRLRLRRYPASQTSPTPQYWIERKRRLGVFSEKIRRLWAAEDIRALLLDPWAAAAAFGALDPELSRAPLVPAVMAQVRRRSFADEQCRITIDRDVSFFPAPRGGTLPESMAGSVPVLVEPFATLEVKTAGAGARWIEELVGELPRHRHSTFVRASRALAP